jgi:hypothetical protein
MALIFSGIFWAKYGILLGAPVRRQVFTFKGPYFCECGWIYHWHVLYFYLSYAMSSTCI